MIKIAGNGAVIGTSEVYESKANAEAGTVKYSIVIITINLFVIVLFWVLGCCCYSCNDSKHDQRCG
jgi:heme/copper-type cytochrome/quinol oxidase subunit 2